MEDREKRLKERKRLMRAALEGNSPEAIMEVFAWRLLEAIAGDAEEALRRFREAFRVED